MNRIVSRGGWVLAGALALFVVLSVARGASGGGLDPTGPPASTMKTLADLVPAWHQSLSSTGGCTSTRFSCVLSNQAVLDAETGLVWERTPLYNDPLPWADARSSCESASTGSRLGWRLPTSTEMLSIIDPVTGNLPSGHPFTGVTGTGFWTSTTDPSDSTLAETVGVGGFFGGQHGGFGKAAPNGDAWCVRGQTGFDAAAPQDVSSWSRQLFANDNADPCSTSRFQCVLSSEAVLDRETGLVWQRNPSANASSQWAPAFDTCIKANTGGRHGWRMATVAEVLTLFDPSNTKPDPSLPTGHPFQNMTGSIFWTATDVATDSSQAYSFSTTGFLSGTPGTINMFTKTGSTTAPWCVRGPDTQ